MSSVGETLRRERLRKELGLEQISRETKISARLLDAIEREQFDLLPGGVFAKSFVRQYARFLGLDEEELAAELEKSINPAPELPSLGGSSTEHAFRIPPVEWGGGGRSNSSPLPALALVVTVMLVCAVVYAWWSRRPAASAQPAVTAQKTAALQNPAPNATPAPSVPIASTPASPSAEALAATPETNPAAAQGGNPDAALHVSLTAASDTCWVQAWADGKSVMIATLRPDLVKTVDASGAVRIRTGNAGDLQLTVNGKPAGPIGPKGQIRIVEITREGVQILPPPPKPAAPEPL